MTYRIALGERIAQAARRVAREEIDGALQDLARPDPDEAVHEVRKHFKRLRALLRLLRGDLGKRAASERNAWYREAARTLSDSRDSKIVIEGVRALIEGRQGEVRTALDRLTAALEARHAEHRARLTGPDGVLPALAAPLRAMRDDVDRWPLSRHGFAALAPGLRRTYRRGARRLAAALAEPTSENLHAWRKRVKDLWYHVSLLEEAWPEALDPLVLALEALSDRLGIDHDYAVLDALLHAEPALCPDPLDRARVETAIDEQRARLQGEAWPLGGRIWAEDADAFTARIGGRWSAWR